MYRTGGPLRGEESGIRWSLEEGRHFRTTDAPPRVPAEYFHDRLDEYRGKRGQRKLAVEPEGRAREIIEGKFTMVPRLTERQSSFSEPNVENYATHLGYA